MKKLRLFDSLKIMRAMFVAVACVFILNIAHAATLPAGYTELEYIESTGTQYIDTNITASTRAIIDMQGTPRTDTVIVFMLAPINATAYQNGFGQYQSTMTGNFDIATRRVYDVSYTSNSMTVNGVNQGSSRYIANNVDLALFGSTATSTNRKIRNAKLYSAKIYNNDTLLRNFIPARHDADNGKLGLYDMVSGEFFTNAGTGEFIAGEWQIKIATTRYNEEQFEPVQNELSNAMDAVDDVVTRTMTQAQAIDTIATTKQTRPDETCPPFKKCLLVEDENGTPHWYEIYDPINDFLNPILAAAGLSGNQGAPTQTTHTENGSTLYDTSNIFYNGSGAFRKKYIDNTTSAADRPFGPTTLPRCADDATRTTSTVNAGICYNTGGMIRELTEGADDDSGEWALVWNGAEGGASLGITPGVVYGVAKCTSVGQHTTQIDGDVLSGSDYWWPKKLTGYSGGGTTLASLIEQYPNSNVEDAFNQLPNPYGTDDNPDYPRANYRNCWCKMTAIGVPGSGDTPDQRYANGTIMSVGGGWVFHRASTSAPVCAYDCAAGCATFVRAYAAFRRAVLGLN